MQQRRAKLSSLLISVSGLFENKTTGLFKKFRRLELVEHKLGRPSVESRSRVQALSRMLSLMEFEVSGNDVSRCLLRDNKRTVFNLIVSVIHFCTILFLNSDELSECCLEL